jgi:hypothetical protein
MIYAALKEPPGIGHLGRGLGTRLEAGFEIMN